MVIRILRLLRIFRVFKLVQYLVEIRVLNQALRASRRKITLTTVGYRDISPKTGFGQALAAVIMIIGYAIIAVPTGIVTTEIARSAGRRVSTQACRVCSAEGHDIDAKCCKYCGAKL
ncbi:MAG: potassium channel family protein [Deltaproteobacteria bacterium]|nr:potassium channel family protein [Deltaproteobacteria bacterium]